MSVFDSGGKTLLRNQLMAITPEICTFRDLYNKIQKSMGHLPPLDIVIMRVTASRQTVGQPSAEEFSLLLDDAIEVLTNFDTSVKHINFSMVKHTAPSADDPIEIDTGEPSTGKTNAFSVLMNAQARKKITWSTNMNKKDEMAIDFLKYADDKVLKIEFSGSMSNQECQNQLSKVISAFWYLDGRKELIQSRSGKDFKGKLPTRLVYSDSAVYRNISMYKTNCQILCLTTFF